MANLNENYTMSYAGHMESDGGAFDITIPFQPDAFFLYNYTAYGTGADNVECIWFRDFPAGDVLVKHVIADDGSTSSTNLQLETTNGCTLTTTAAGVASSIVAISGATAASPVVVTTAAHGITVGQKVRVRITDVLGMVELNSLTRNPYLAEALTSTTFALKDLDNNNIDGSAFTAYTSGGKLNLLEHLTGQGDGPVNYTPPVYTLTLGTAVTNDDADELYFIAWKFGQYVDLGDQA